MRVCVYIYIYRCELINGGCETFDDIYMQEILEEILFIYMHNVYNM